MIENTVRILGSSERKKEEREISGHASRVHRDSRDERDLEAA